MRTGIVTCGPRELQLPGRQHQGRATQPKLKRTGNPLISESFCESVKGHTVFDQHKEQRDVGWMEDDLAPRWGMRVGGEGRLAI
jgi:hypothetical protein